MSKRSVIWSLFEKHSLIFVTRTAFQELLLTPFNVHEILGIEILSSEKHFCHWEISQILLRVRGLDPWGSVPLWPHAASRKHQIRLNSAMLGNLVLFYTSCTLIKPTAPKNTMIHNIAPESALIFCNDAFPAVARHTGLDTHANVLRTLGARQAQGL